MPPPTAPAPASIRTALPLAALRDARSLDRALRALAAAGLAIEDLDVHAMDEYSHDVVAPVADGLVLVFDTT
jgi:hypothetical protein